MAKPLILSELVQVDFPENQYYREETDKKQIVLHHTVSNGSADGVISWWNQDPQKIATHFIIDSHGSMYQLYSSRWWAHHLGIKSEFLKKQGFKDYLNRNTILNKASIGIEVCNWGGLVKDSNGFHPAKWDVDLKKYVPYSKITIPNDNVQTYPKPFRDFIYFEKYTPSQIESINRLVVYLCDKFDIPKTYQSSMWDVSKEALSGESGVFSHISMRTDKSDLHPQPEVINMLKSLS